MEKEMKKTKCGIIVLCLTLLLGAVPPSANSQVKTGVAGSVGGSVTGGDKLLPIERDVDYFKESVRYYEDLANDSGAELTSELRDLIKKIAKGSDSWENKLTAIEQAVFAYWATEPWCTRDLAKFESWLKDYGIKLLPSHSRAVIGDMLSAASACSERFGRAQQVAEFYQPEEISKLYNTDVPILGGRVENLTDKVAQARSVVADKMQAKRKKIAPCKPIKPCRPGRPCGKLLTTRGG